MIRVFPAGKTQVDRTVGHMETRSKGKIFPFMHLFEKGLSRNLKLHESNLRFQHDVRIFFAREDVCLPSLRRDR